MNIAGLQVVLLTFIAIGCFNIVKGSESLQSTYVCEGDNISLTCSTANGTNIIWDVAFPDNCNSSVTSASVLRTLMVPHPPEAVICNTHLYFSKSSDSHLTSTILMENVTSDVDGVEIKCRHEDGNSSTLIHVVKGVPDVFVRVASEVLGADNITVHLEYEKEPDVAYTFTVLDLTTMTSTNCNISRFHNESSIPLTLSYNTEYRVSFTASRCGQLSINVSDFHFGNGTGVNYADSTTSQSGTVIMTTPTDSSIITGVSVGVAIVVVILVIVILSLISTLVIKTRRKAERSDKTSPIFTCTLRPTEQEITENNQGPEAHNADNLGPVQKQTFGMIYADVGTNPKPNSVKLIVDDSSRVDYAQIRIQSLVSLNETDTHTKCEEVKDNPNNADDFLNLDSLLIQMKPEVTSKWYHFGQALGVDNKILDACLPYPPEQNIVEVCDNWLRNHTGKPAWWEIAEALKKIDFQQLALDIERVYETGNLPKAVNMNADLKEYLTDDLVEPPPALPPRSY